MKLMILFKTCKTMFGSGSPLKQYNQNGNDNKMSAGQSERVNNLSEHIYLKERVKETN